MKQISEDSRLMQQRLSPLSKRILCATIQNTEETEGGIFIPPVPENIWFRYKIDHVFIEIPATLLVAQVIKVPEKIFKEYGFLLGNLIIARTGDSSDGIVACNPETDQEWFILAPELVEMVIETNETIIL